MLRRKGGKLHFFASHENPEGNMTALEHDMFSVRRIKVKGEHSEWRICFAQFSQCYESLSIFTSVRVALRWSGGPSGKI